MSDLNKNLLGDERTLVLMSRFKEILIHNLLVFKSNLNKNLPSDELTLVLMSIPAKHQLSDELTLVLMCTLQKQST